MRFSERDVILLGNIRVLRYLVRYWEMRLEVEKVVDFLGVLRVGIEIWKRSDF